MTPRNSQILLICLGILNFIGGATAQLDILLGPTAEKLVVAAIALVGGSLSIIAGVLIGPGAQASNVSAMLGKGGSITVGPDAEPAIVAMAADPTNKVVSFAKAA